ncbi:MULTISPECIES: hypothetical protein [Thermocrispum]|jgi:hypothetical protein|uniref:Uncharacterized protein n=1 Tax=Thermocrispum agreste TaxID=37925 RepID=A0ABD6FK68_9PSEU|nr:MULTISPECIES: hypothetical protein [Thermocrispum]
MTVWFVIAVPLVVLFFALFMERVEEKLANVTVRETEVEEFLESAQPHEVKALYKQGIGRALELFRLRRRGRAARLRADRAAGTHNGRRTPLRARPPERARS